MQLYPPLTPPKRGIEKSPLGRGGRGGYCKTYSHNIILSNYKLSAKICVPSKVFSCILFWLNPIQIIITRKPAVKNNETIRCIPCSELPLILFFRVCLSGCIFPSEIQYPSPCNIFHLLFLRFPLEIHRLYQFLLVSSPCSRRGLPLEMAPALSCQHLLHKF